MKQDSPRLIKSLESSSFDFSELRRRTATPFIRNHHVFSERLLLFNMVRLPSEVSQHLEIDPNIEYDAVIRMPPRRVTRIFQLLSLEKTNYVSISVKDTGGVNQVSFIKDRGDPNVILDRSGDSASSDEDINMIYEGNAYRYQVNCSHNAGYVQPDEDINMFYDSSSSDEDINMIYEDEYKYQISCNHNADHVQPQAAATAIEMTCEVSNCLCMMCLHDRINWMNEECPNATQVTMYLGSGLPNVALCRVPVHGAETVEVYMAPVAKHTYHSKRRREKVWSASLLLEAMRWWEMELAASERGRRNDPEEEDGQEGETW